MGHKEREIIDLRLANLRSNERMFRTNSGMGFAGKSVRKGKHVIVQNAYPLRAMPEGWPDLTGFTTIEITPDMIGEKIAVFTVEEIKATGSLSIHQKRFKNLFEKMGAIYRVITKA